MARRGVKRLPVVNAEGMLEGVVSRADLLKVFLRTDEELAEELRRDVVEPLLPAFQGKVGVRVSNGVVTLTGRVVNTSVVPLATRMARTVEGVVDVEWDLADETTAVDS
jgi:CBS domain-containing protein